MGFSKALITPKSVRYQSTLLMSINYPSWFSWARKELPERLLWAEKRSRKGKTNIVFCHFYFLSLWLTVVFLPLSLFHCTVNGALIVPVWGRSRCTWYLLHPLPFWQLFSTLPDCLSTELWRMVSVLLLLHLEAFPCKPWLTTAQITCAKRTSFTLAGVRKPLHMGKSAEIRTTF